MAVTYTMLKSGEWGIRSTTALTPGASVAVVKKSGEAKAETVGNLVWSGNGVYLYGIRAAVRSTVRRGYGGSRECCGYPCPVTGRKCTPSDPCHDCQ